MPGWLAVALAVAVLAEVTAGTVGARVILSRRPTAAVPVLGGVRSGPVRPAARPAPGPAASDVRNAAVRGLLERRGAAVLAHDRAGFLATVDPDSPEFLARQAALYDNLSGVVFSTWTYTLDAASDHAVPAAVASRLGADAWLPTVVL